MELDIEVSTLNGANAEPGISAQALTKWLTTSTVIEIGGLEKKVKQFHFIECTDRQRLELLDWIRPLLTNSAYAVRAAIADGQLPLPENVLNDIEGLRRINAVMADLYKVTILSLSQKVLDTSERPLAERQRLNDDLILACYGAINFLAEQLRTAYEAYSPAPKGIWHEIHHIYNYARYILDISNESGLDGEKIRDEFFLIEHVYKRSLLLGLCNPYHFPVSAFGALNRTLNKWAHMSIIHHDRVPDEQKCMFSIDYESDYPAAPVLTSSASHEDSERYAVLDTREAVMALNYEIDAGARHIFEYTAAERPRDSLLNLEMLRRLVMNWGKHPIRRDFREQKQGKCEIVAGYTQIMASMTGMLVSSLRQESLDQSRCCNIVDASDMGYQVEFTQDCQIRFRIGDMIAMRDADYPGVWSLAVVRWARYTTHRRIRVGMFIMGRQAERYKLRPVLDSERKTVHVLSVTGTSNFPGDKKIFLVPAGLYRPGQVMELTEANAERVVAGNLIMSGVGFDVFDYRPL